MSWVLHGLAVAAFALLALSGAGVATQGLYGLGVPFIITGLAGAAGAALFAVRVGPPRTVRFAMTAAAVVALIAGVLLAPGGVDRGFVISVAALLAATLALFALFVGDRPRTAARGR